MTLLDAITALERSQGHLQEQVQIVRGRLGLQDGTVLGSRSGYHWVRLFGLANNPVQAFNNKTAPTANLDVYVAVDPYRREGAAPYTVMGTVATVGTVMDALLDEQSKAEELVGAHARSHEFGEANLGRDAVNVYARALVPLRAQETSPASMQVYVQPGYFSFQGDVLFPGGLTAEITAPVAGTRFDLVYLDCATVTVKVATGTPAVTVYDVLAAPATPANGIALAYVVLGPDTTAIGEQNIFDMRPLLAYGGKLDWDNVWSDAVHSHASDAEGGKLEADDALQVTGGTTGHVLTVQADDTIAAAALPALADHDHTGDAGDGGKLEADDALQVTGGTTGHVLTVQADDTIAAAALPALADHDHTGDAGDGGVLPMQFYLGYYTSAAWDGDAKNGADGVIDLSAAFGVPAGVKAVSVRFSAADETVGVIFRLSQDSDPTSYGVVQRTQVANIQIHVCGIVPCDANGDIYFSQSGELDTVGLEITGYWI